MSVMCDYMYYEQKQKSKLKNVAPEPELEKAEEQPIPARA